MGAGSNRAQSEGRGLALVILAAGESSRLRRCKALVPITPRTPLDLLCEAGFVLGGPAPLVVTGADHDAIVAAAGDGLEIARNPDWRAGRTGGVLLAARLRPGHDLCIAPVDTPLVPSAVFRALDRTWREAGQPARGWAAPWVRAGVGAGVGGSGERAFGHPVVLGRDLALKITETGPGVPLKSLRDWADPLLAVEVSAREILDDLDRPDDLLRLRGRSGA